MAVFGDTVKLFFDGHHLELPADLERDVEFMVETDEPFRTPDLPGQSTRRAAWFSSAVSSARVPGGQRGRTRWPVATNDGHAAE